MLYLMDKGDNWSHLSEDMKTVVYDDGTQEPLTSAHLQIEMGKHKGQLLSSISDRGYLQWFYEAAKEKDLIFVANCITKRIKELP